MQDNFASQIVFLVSRRPPCQQRPLLLVFGGREENRPPKTRDNCRPLLFPVEVKKSEGSSGVISIGNSMICSDISRLL